jgi:hypothetical protein
VKADKKIGFIVGIVLFAVYFFMAARPVPLETVLIPCWLNSIETGTPVYLGGAPAQAGEEEAASGEFPMQRIPFTLGNRFGYVSRDGLLSVNQVKKANVSLSRERWAEYEAEPSRIAVHDNAGEQAAVIETPRGYPFFLDGRTFLISSEQNAISAIDETGAVSWAYEFAGPLTCVDSAAGLLLVGSLDGAASLLDSGGRQVFSFEPGGSLYSIILGCAISHDGSRLALISGIDGQRFLVLERFGPSAGDYKVVYHEFLGGGFRRPVYISFVEDDRWIVFERAGGLGFYEISSRKSDRVELGGDVYAVDHSGGKGMVFAVISRSENAKELVGIRLPGRVIIESPFKSEEVFLGRMDSRLIVGGGQTLVSFDLEKK